jgi:hypothetical protein
MTRKAESWTGRHGSRFKTQSSPLPRSEYGWEIVVEFCECIVPVSGVNTSTKQFAYRNVTEHRARRNGMLKSHAVRVISAEPLTQEQFERAYGLRQRM